jgi:hypothetical protein
MKKNEVKIGNVYTAKVTNKVVQVRIDAENRHGGWDATNLETGKKVRIQSAQRLRSAVGAVASTTAKKTKSKKNAKVAVDAQPGQSSSPMVEGVPGSEPATTEATAKPKRQRAAKALKEKRMSGLDAAAKVLAERGEPMSAKEMIEAAESKGYWKSPGGKTPQATLYSAIIREINVKGAEARFRKTDRGRFDHA